MRYIIIGERVSLISLLLLIFCRIFRIRTAYVHSADGLQSPHNYK